MRRIKDNLSFILITACVALMPLFVGLILWNSLPDQMIVRFTFEGEPDSYASKGFVVFGIGLYMVAIHLFCTFVTGFGVKNEKGISDKLFKLLLCICPFISIFVTTLIYSTAMGYSLDVAFWMQIMLGIIYIVLGNYLPKARQNSVFGTRIKWTLESRKNWEHTHRFTGWIMCVLGLFFMISAFTGMLVNLGSELGIGFLVTIVVIFVLVSVLYSYIYYVKHGKDEDYYE